MTKILRVESSIKGDAAVSRRLTDRIIRRLQSANPDVEIVTRDLSKGMLPIDGAWISAVYTAPEARNDAQREISDYADTLLAEVKAADKIGEHTAELQSRENLVCRLLLDK